MPTATDTILRDTTDAYMRPLLGEDEWARLAEMLRAAGLTPAEAAEAMRSKLVRHGADDSYSAASVLAYARSLTARGGGRPPVSLADALRTQRYIA